MLALEADEVVVAALPAVRILAAHRGPGFVDGAAPLVGVEEAANGAVDLVLVVAQDALVAVGVAIATCEALLGLLAGQAEVARQPLEILVEHFDARVAAAITGAARAVVLVLFGFVVGHGGAFGAKGAQV